MAIYSFCDLIEISLSPFKSQIQDWKQHLTPLPEPTTTVMLLGCRCTLQPESSGASWPGVSEAPSYSRDANCHQSPVRLTQAASKHLGAFWKPTSCPRPTLQPAPSGQQQERGVYAPKPQPPSPRCRPAPRVCAVSSAFSVSTGSRPVTATTRQMRRDQHSPILARGCHRGSEALSHKATSFPSPCLSFCPGMSFTRRGVWSTPHESGEWLF